MYLWVFVLHYRTGGTAVEKVLFENFIQASLVCVVYNEICDNREIKTRRRNKSSPSETKVASSVKVCVDTGLPVRQRRKLKTCFGAYSLPLAPYVCTSGIHQSRPGLM